MTTATLTVYDPQTDGAPQERGRFLLFWIDGRARPFLGTYAYDEIMEMYAYKELGTGKERAIHLTVRYYAYVDTAALVIL